MYRRPPRLTLPDTILPYTTHFRSPGFVDAQARGSHGDDELVPQQNWSEIVNLAMGTTTSHNPSSRASEIFVSSEMQRAGLILAPRIFSTGEVIYGAKAAGVYEIGRAHV